MPLVPAKCTQCGASIKVDDTKESGICSFCGTSYIVEKAINNYNEYIKNDYHIANAEVHIHDEKSTEKKLKNADIFFTKQNDPQKARELFLEVANDDPGDYRGWWGVARVDSKDFKYTNCSDSIFSEIEVYVNSAFNVISNDKKSELSKIWNKFKNKRESFVQECQQSRNSYLNSINNFDAKINDLNNQLDEICKTRENLIQAKNKAENAIDGILCVEGIAVLCIMTILFLVFATIIGYILLCLTIILIFFAVYKRSEIKGFDAKISQLESAETDINNEINNLKNAVSDMNGKINEIDNVLK